VKDDLTEPYFFVIILITSIIGFPLLSITPVVQLFSSNNGYVAYGSLPDFNFAAAGDWGCTDITTYTVNNISAKDPELVIGLGDYSYEPTADCWFEKIAAIEDRMKIAIGNHDDSYERQENPTLLKQYMTNFNLSRQFYSFDHQNVHFTFQQSFHIVWELISMNL
jgi:hypothetical protein